MTDDRPATWTITEDYDTGEWWSRWIDEPLVLELVATSYTTHGPPGWRWEVLLVQGAYDNPESTTIRSMLRTDPLPTRELAQAAAEQWVRDFGAGLVAAVSP